MDTVDVFEVGDLARIYQTPVEKHDANVQDGRF